MRMSQMRMTKMRMTKMRMSQMRISHFCHCHNFAFVTVFYDTNVNFKKVKEKNCDKHK